MQIQSPNEANPYVYAGADPVNKVDPRGTYVTHLGVEEAAAAVLTVSTGAAGCGAAALLYGVDEAAAAPGYAICVAAVDTVGAASFGIDVADEDDGFDIFGQDVAIPIG